MLGLLFGGFLIGNSLAYNHKVKKRDIETMQRSAKRLDPETIISHDFGGNICINGEDCFVDSKEHWNKSYKVYRSLMGKGVMYDEFRSKAIYEWIPKLKKKAIEVLDEGKPYFLIKPFESRFDEGFLPVDVRNLQYYRLSKTEIKKGEFVYHKHYLDEGVGFRKGYGLCDSDDIWYRKSLRSRIISEEEYKMMGGEFFEDKRLDRNESVEYQHCLYRLNKRIGEENWEERKNTIKYFISPYSLLEEIKRGSLEEWENFVKEKYGIDPEPHYFEFTKEEKKEFDEYVKSISKEK